MSVFLTMLIKPFVFFVMFCSVYLIAYGIHKAMPDSKLKRILFKPLPGHREKSRWN